MIQSSSSSPCTSTVAYWHCSTNCIHTQSTHMPKFVHDERFTKSHFLEGLSDLIYKIVSETSAHSARVGPNDNRNQHGQTYCCFQETGTKIQANQQQLMATPETTWSFSREQQLRHNK